MEAVNVSAAEWRLPNDTRSHFAVKIFGVHDNPKSQARSELAKEARHDEYALLPTRFRYRRLRKLETA